MAPGRHVPLVLRTWEGQQEEAKVDLLKAWDPRSASQVAQSKDSVTPGNDLQATKYRNLREQRLAAMEAILWDEEKGAWFDYDLENRRKNQEFYPSNLAPLWSGCFSDPGVVDKALKYLEVRGAVGRAGILGAEPPPLPRLTQGPPLPPALPLCLSLRVPLEPPGGSCEPRRESPGRDHLTLGGPSPLALHPVSTHSPSNVWNLLGQPDLDLPVRDPDLSPEHRPAVGLPQCLGPLAGPGHQR